MRKLKSFKGFLGKLRPTPDHKHVCGRVSLERNRIPEFQISVALQGRRSKKVSTEQSLRMLPPKEGSLLIASRAAVFVSTETQRRAVESCPQSLHF